MSIENKISLLWNCALALKNDQQIHKILKSYYVNTCRNLSRNSVLLPKEKLATSQMCSHCGYFWYEGKFRTKSIPRRSFNNARTKKLIEKLEKTNNNDNGTPLNKSQRKRAKWLKKCLSNRLEITCENCKRKSVIEMEIPKTKLANTEEKLVKSDSKNSMNIKSDEKSQKNPVEQNLLTQKQKIDTSQEEATSSKLLKVQSEGKKNKKKNNATTKVLPKTQSQNSLLQIAALLKKNPQQVKLVKSDSKNGMNIKSDKKSQKQKIDASQPMTTSSKVLKIESERKKNKKNIAAAKVISKTQSQNSLLKLAALLKKNPQQVKSKTNKLDSFLK